MAKNKCSLGIASEVEAIFHPRSIAVVGTSANRDSPGYDYVLSLLEFGYRGSIYPVNPRLEELLGLPVYPSLGDIPGPADYVIACIPAAAVLPLIDDCAAKGVRALQLFTARFRETGRREDARLEAQLGQRARQAGVRIIGPNCMGLLYPRLGISFRPDMGKEPGPVGFLSQSGNLLFELNYYGGPRGLRFSKAISYGNALDLNEGDFLEYFAHDGETAVIGTYIEGVRDGRRFLAALGEAAARKPVVVLKGGRTAAGGRLATSHTAALAGDRQVWEAAVRQAGALWVDTVEELIDLLIAFSYMRPGGGSRVGMVGGGGGRSVLSADLGEELGLTLPPLPRDMEERIGQRALPLKGWLTNPVDQSIVAGSGLGGADILEMMEASPQFDALVASLNEAWSLGRPNAEPLVQRVTERFIQVGRKTAKPLAVVVGPADYSREWQRRLVAEARDTLVEAGLAVFPSVERAIRTLARVLPYWQERMN